MEAELVYIVLAAIFGIFMAWGIGANDVANAMATSVGSKALTIKQAILVAAVFEFLGAVLAGGEVTSTIRKGIVDTSPLVGQPELLVYGMLAALLAAGCWLFIASRNGWPVSTTHSIVGAIVGFAAVGIGVDAVQWEMVGEIVMSWVASPLTAGFIAYLIYQSVQRLILRQGYEVLRRFREYDTSTPVLMLTARGEEMDKVRGLRSGADDYVTKPFGLMELLARIEVLLRRGQERSGSGVDPNAAPICVRDIEVNLVTRSVHREGRRIDLAPKEFDLLVELLRHDGAIISRTELMRAVWAGASSIASPGGPRRDFVGHTE